MGQRLPGRRATFGSTIEPVVIATVVTCDPVPEQLPLSQFHQSKKAILDEDESLGPLVPLDLVIRDQACRDTRNDAGGTKTSGSDRDAQSCMDVKRRAHLETG